MAPEGSSQHQVTVIIPSWDGSRDGNVEKLKEQLNSQILKPNEIIVVVGVSPNGKARNEGVARAKENADFFVFIDDDVTLGNDAVLANLIKPFAKNQKVGMTGPAQLIPEDSRWWQRAAARQIPRSLFPVQDKLVDSDMVSHMCLCIPAQLFKDVGQENPDIIAGTDPDLRYRVRQTGYRVCVVPDCWAYHPMPPRFLKLLRMAYVKGKNSAIVRKKYPELVFELDTGHRQEFTATKPLPFRTIRFFGQLTSCLITFRFFYFLYLMLYAFGNLNGSLSKK